MDTSCRFPLASLFLFGLLITILCSSFTVRSDWDFNPIDDVVNDANSTVENTTNFATDVVNGTVNAINDTKDAAANVVNGTTNAIDDTKNAADFVVNATKNVVPGASGAPSLIPAGQVIPLVLASAGLAGFYMI